MLDESLKVHDWNRKVPVKDSMLNKSGRIYKDDQKLESLLLIQPHLKSWALCDQQILFKTHSIRT